MHETYFATKPVGRARRRVLTVYDMTHELFFYFLPEAIICDCRQARRRQSRRPRNLHFRKHAARPRASLRHRPGTYQRCAPWVFTNRGGESGAGGQRRAQAFASVCGTSRGIQELQHVTAGLWQLSHPAGIRADCFRRIPRYYATSRKRSGRLGITDRVRFKSGSDQELAARYREAAAFVYPSMYEGFGIPRWKP